MRTHLLALATSAALVVTFGCFEASAQQRSDYGAGWRDQQGDGYRGRRDEQSEGYGRGRRDERGEDYGRGRRERGEGYGGGRREDQDEGYGRRSRNRRDDGMMEHGMMRQSLMGPGMMGQMGPGMMSSAMMRMMFVLMDTDGDGTVSLGEFQAAHERHSRPSTPTRMAGSAPRKWKLPPGPGWYKKVPDRRPSRRGSSAPETGPARPDENSAH